MKAWFAVLPVVAAMIAPQASAQPQQPDRRRSIEICEGRNAPTCQTYEGKVTGTEPGQVSAGVVRSDYNPRFVTTSNGPWRLCVGLDTLRNASVETERTRCRVLEGAGVVSEFPQLTGSFVFTPLLPSEAQDRRAYAEVYGGWRCADARCSVERTWRRATIGADPLAKEKAASICRTHKLGEPIEWYDPEEIEVGRDKGYALWVRCVEQHLSAK